MRFDETRIDEMIPLHLVNLPELSRWTLAPGGSAVLASAPATHDGHNFHPNTPLPTPTQGFRPSSRSITNCRTRASQRPEIRVKGAHAGVSGGRVDGATPDPASRNWGRDDVMARRKKVRAPSTANDGLTVNARKRAARA